MADQPKIIPTVALELWRLARDDKNGELVMVLKPWNEQEMGIQMPGETAIALGRALIKRGEETRSPGKTKAN